MMLFFQEFDHGEVIGSQSLHYINGNALLQKKYNIGMEVLEGGSRGG